MSAATDTALAAVTVSGRHLASDLRSDRRWQAARTHEANLLALARARASSGTATYGDQRILANAEIIGDYAIEAYSLNGGES